MDDERVLDGHQDVFLVLDMVDLFEANDLGDRQHFECEVFASRTMPRQNDASERSRSFTERQLHVAILLFSAVNTKTLRSCNLTLYQKQ